MGKLGQRHEPLSDEEKTQVRSYAIAARIKVMNSFLASNSPQYESRVAAAIFARGLAEFLGLGYSYKTDSLREYKDHFEHENGMSWELKVTDVGGRFIAVSELSPSQKQTLKDGFRITHTAFVHFTHWRNPTTQNPDGSPTADYSTDELDLLKSFVSEVITLWKNALK